MELRATQGHSETLECVSKLYPCPQHVEQAASSEIRNKKAKKVQKNGATLGIDPQTTRSSLGAQPLPTSHSGNPVVRVRHNARFRRFSTCYRMIAVIHAILLYVGFHTSFRLIN